MTNQSRERWLISHPEMLGVLHAADAIAVDLDQLTPDQIDQAIKAEDMGYIPTDILETGHNLANLIADGLRWRTYMATPYSNSNDTRGNHLSFGDEVRCPACELAGDGPRWIDPRTALVVPWDVMGDARPYVLVCPEHDHAEPVTGECDLCARPYTLGADDHNPETGNHYECETEVTP